MGSEEDDPSWRAPAFFDDLPKIHLSSDALREVTRRSYRPRISRSSLPNPSPTARDILSTLTRRVLKKVERFSRTGGPDLAELRQCPSPAGYEGSMVPSQVTYNLAMASKLTTYSPNAREKLIQHGVYPHDHPFPNGQKPAKPANLGAIVSRLSREHPSSQQLSERTFDEFLEANRKVDNGEGTREATERISRLIEGEDPDASKCTKGFLFNHFETLTQGFMGQVKPNLVAGARSEQLDSKIRARLHGHILPSEQHSLIAPNFFFEVKSGATNSTISCQVRSCYEGAFGTRAIHAIQSFGHQEKNIYDHQAYTITVMFFNSVLRFYAHHPVMSADGTCREYITTLIRGYYIEGSLEMFQEGVAAYRNAREWAKEQRDEIIMAANARKALPGALVPTSHTANAEETVAPNDPEAEEEALPTAAAGTKKGKGRSSKRKSPEAKESGSTRKTVRKRRCKK